MSMNKGGGNLVEIYPVAQTTFGIATIFPSLASSIGSVLTLNNIKSSAFTGHEKSQNLSLSLSQYKFDPQITALFDQYLSVASTSTTENFEDGVSVEAAASTSYDKMVLVKSYGTKNPTDGAYVKMFYATLTGGDMTYQDGSYVAPGTTLTAIAAPATVTFASTSFVATKVKTPATVTLPSGEFGKSVWM